VAHLKFWLIAWFLARPLPQRFACQAMDSRSNNKASQVSERMAELERTCFVIMPFGKKDVGGK
jgi:hypothetical protein